MSLIALALGAASKGHTTGYDVFVNLSNASSFNYWPASHQQIYREFNKLYADGYLVLDVIRQDGKPDKKVYSITESGLAHLKEMMYAPPRLDSFRDEMVVKYHNLHCLDADERKEFWDMQAEFKEELMTRFEFIEAQLTVLDSKMRMSGIEDLDTTVLRMRLVKERTNLETDMAWLDVAEKQITSHPEYKKSMDTKLSLVTKKAANK